LRPVPPPSSPRAGRLLRACVLGAAIAAVAIPPAHAQTAGDWPQLQGDAAHAGVAAGGPPPPYAQRWAFEESLGGPTGATGLSAPVASEGLIVTLAPEAVIALDAVEGTERWRIDRRTGPTVPPAIGASDGEAIVVFPEGFGPNPPGSEPTDALAPTPSPSPTPEQGAGVELVAVTLEDGEERWRMGVPSPTRSGVTVDGDAAYVGSNDGSVSAVDLATGELRWSTDAGGTILGPVAVADGLVVVSAPGDADQSFAVAALGVDDGEQVWRYEPTAPTGVGGPPAAGEDLVVVGLQDRTVRALDLTDGTERWTARLNSVVSPFVSPAVDGEAVIAADIGGQVYRFDAADGARAWDHALNVPVLRSSPVLLDEHVLVASQDGDLFAVERDSGDLVWRGSAGAGVLRTPAVVGDLVVGVRAGERPGLVAFATDTEGSLERVVTPTALDLGDLLASFAVAAVPVSALALALGAFLLRRMGPADLSGEGDEPVDPIEDALRGAE
jgi:outer membrane protein assembly factor BamB